MTLGENIYRLRSEKHMSQGDLADALNVSRQSVSKWENNTAVPELEKLIKMCELFGISLDELVYGHSQQFPAQSVNAHNPTLSMRKIIGIILLIFTLILFLWMFLIPHIDTESWLALICACILLTTSFLAFESKFACGICTALCIFSFFMLLHGSDSRFNLWFLLYTTPVALIWGSLRLWSLWKDFGSKRK